MKVPYAHVVSHTLALSSVSKSFAFLVVPTSSTNRAVSCGRESLGTRSGILPPTNGRKPRLPRFFESTSVGVYHAEGSPTRLRGVREDCRTCKEQESKNAGVNVEAMGGNGDDDLQKKWAAVNEVIHLY